VVSSPSNPSAASHATILSQGTASTKTSALCADRGHSSQQLLQRHRSGIAAAGRPDLPGRRWASQTGCMYASFQASQSDWLAWTPPGHPTINTS